MNGSGKTNCQVLGKSRVETMPKVNGNKKKKKKTTSTDKGKPNVAMKRKQPREQGSAWRQSRAEQDKQGGGHKTEAPPSRSMLSSSCFSFLSVSSSRPCLSLALAKDTHLSKRLAVTSLKSSSST